MLEYLLLNSIDGWKKIDPQERKGLLERARHAHFSKNKSNGVYVAVYFFSIVVLSGLVFFANYLYADHIVVRSVLTLALLLIGFDLMRAYRVYSFLDELKALVQSK